MNPRVGAVDRVPGRLGVVQGELVALTRIKVISVFGTRPEAIKMAPVVKALETVPEIESRVVVTAQHREMLDQVLESFFIKADYDLDIMDYNQSLAQITVRVLERLTPVLESERPAILLVHGDTTTAAASALAAYYLKISCGHVEAGLRTGDKYAPFPEEMMRRIADDISDIHFAPTPVARDNLLKEGFSPENIYVTGNTVVDALLQTVKADYVFRSPRLRSVLKGLQGINRESSGDRRQQVATKYILVEVHRRENFGPGMEEIGKALRWIGENRPDVRLLVSVHPNPNVKEPLLRWLEGCSRAITFDPLDYPDYVNLMSRCYLVISDSGGVQEEAPSLQVPVVLCREKTERPEALDAGFVVLTGASTSAICSTVCRLLDDARAYENMRPDKNPFGDGLASGRIVGAILYKYNLARVRPHEFGEEGDGGVRIQGD